MNPTPLKLDDVVHIIRQATPVNAEVMFFSLRIRNMSSPDAFGNALQKFVNATNERRRKDAQSIGCNSIVEFAVSSDDRASLKIMYVHNISAWSIDDCIILSHFEEYVLVCDAVGNISLVPCDYFERMYNVSLESLNLSTNRN